MVASDYYKERNNFANGNVYLLKVAYILVNKDDYLEAAKIFEQIAIDSLRGSGYNSKIYFKNCLLCLMASNLFEHASLKSNDFLHKDKYFGSSREYLLISDLLKSYTNKNVELFDNSYNSYNSLTPFQLGNAISKIRELIV